MFLQIFLRTLLPFGLPIAMIFVVIYLARARFAWLGTVPLWVWIGLIILLFVLNKMGEPIMLEQAQQDLQGLIARLEEELYEIRGETARFDRALRSREEQLSKETKNEVDRIVSTLREVGIPMILTTVSTAVGFLSLLFTDVRPIRQLGLFAAIGIGFAGVISFFALPALMTKVGVREDGHDPLLGPRLTRGLKVLVRRRWAAPALVGVVVLFAAIFIPKLEVEERGTA